MRLLRPPRRFPDWACSSRDARRHSLALPTAVEIAWRKALLDADGGAGAVLAVERPELATFFEGLGSSDVPSDLYARYPSWKEHDPILCSGFFTAVEALGAVLDLRAVRTV